MKVIRYQMIPPQSTEDLEREIQRNEEAEDLGLIRLPEELCSSSLPPSDTCSRRQNPVLVFGS